MIRTATVVLILFILSALVETVESTIVFEYLTNKLQGTYTIKGTFRQTVHIRDIDSKRTYKGEFILKKPDKLKWQYLEGSKDTLYINGRDAYLYQPLEKQVFIYPAEGIKGGVSLLLCLWDKEALKREFRINEREGVLLLEPTSRSLSLRWIKIYVSKEEFPVKRLAFEDTYGNRTEIEFLDSEINAPVDNSIFQFIPPEGVTVISE
jgi:outer membrane lipoprotein carrier protein